MKTVLALVVAACLAGAAWWVFKSATAPPEVPFTPAITETLADALSTNGKVEPIEWAAVRAEAEGALVKLHAARGASVAKGMVLAELDGREMQAAVASAEARAAQARAELEVLDRGGRGAELAEIARGMSRAQFDLEIAGKEHEALKRLEAKQAATALEVKVARDRVEQLKVEIRSLEAKRAALVTPPDRAAAGARLREAESALAAARRRLELAEIRSPMAGVVYHVEPRPGAYLRPGDLVLHVGRLDRLRVAVYVDEPELGRVRANMPVTITWDALPGRQWTGSVEKTPAQIQALGTRQVGEVICAIGNPGQDLFPGANISASIRSRVVENALTIPKECVRREAAGTGVFVFQEGRAVWRPVKTGLSNVTRIQILEGLKAGELAALPSAHTLRDGMPVRRAP